MIAHDHDYAGRERSQHEMLITTYFDGDLIWIWLKGAHSWQDGCYCHNWIHAMKLKTFDDIVSGVVSALERYKYITEVVPILSLECGDIDNVFEYNRYADLGPW